MRRENETHEFVEADPKLRRLAVLTVAAGTAIGAVVIGWFMPWLLGALDEAVDSGAVTVPLARWIFLGLVVLLAAPVVGFGVYAVRFGRRVVAVGQYPPPGQHVVRRTRILRGPAATFTGRGQVVLGVFLALCGFALVVVSAWGVWLLAFAPASRQESATALPSTFDAVSTEGLTDPISTGTVIFLEASPAEIDSARAGRTEEDFAVIADDLMYYRAIAHEQLAVADVPVVRVTGRRRLTFQVEGAARDYDFAHSPLLDLIIVYLPEREPVAFPTLEVDLAVKRFRSTGGEDGVSRP